MKSRLSDILVCCPDSRAAHFVSRAFETIGANCLSFIGEKKNFEQTVGKAIQSRNAPILFLMPSGKNGKSTMSLARACAAQNGLTLAFAQTTTENSERHILLELLQQAGAMVAHQLPSLVDAAALFQLLNGASLWQVAVKTKSSFILKEFEESLSTRISNDAQIFKDTEGTTLHIGLSREGFLTATCKQDTVTLPFDTSPLADAINFLWQSRRNDSAVFSAMRVLPDTEIIALIAQPPGRLLSETTSKRLLNAFGVQLPREMLCDSVSAALRFASDIAGPCVLKLVRPHFPSRLAQGAIHLNVSGPSNLRRAYQSLVSLDETLGPPSSLGILVCEQIDEGFYFWVTVRDHPEFGRLLLVGHGNEINDSPDTLFACSATAGQMDTTLKLHWPTLEVAHRISAVSALQRFAHCIETLQGQISSAEVHPFVTRADSSALALDAIIGIAGNFPE